jgi:hypothetical protein
LDNQKNDWKGVCVYHESNGDEWHCPVRALAPRYLHLWDTGANAKTFPSAHFNDKDQCGDVSNEDVSSALKAVATVLDCPSAKGIPINRIDTHSLQSGGKNALSLAGYSDSQIQKWGDGAGQPSKVNPRGVGLLL